MKKNAAFAALLLFVSFIYQLSVYAYTPPSAVRIGLQSQYREVDAVSFENRTLIIGYGANGVFQQSASITRNACFSVSVSNQSFVRVAQEVSDYAHARGLADVYNAQGYVASPAFVDDGRWVVYLGSYASDVEAQAVAGAAGGSVMTANTRRIFLTDGGSVAAVFDSASYSPQMMDGENGYITLGDKKYRGVIEIGRYTGKKLTAVNVLTLEEYLYSTVPSEMPSTWSAEALKAQAVATRSYSVTRMGVHASEGYDLCDTSHCQNYKGVTNEAAASTQAVLETRGVIAYYDGQPINAVYFSSSGGKTEDSENCWANTVPYLRSVTDASEYEPKEWVRSFTMADITELLNKNNVGIGTAQRASIAYSGSGRVGSLTIQGTQGSRTLAKEEIRTFFSPSAGGSLESRNFTLLEGTVQGTGTGSQAFVTGGGAASAVELNNIYGVTADGAAQRLQSYAVRGSGGTSQLSASTSTVSTSGDGVTFVGRGWGHGVGMSQRGAEGMARNGYTYRQILTHYYTGITIE